MLQTNKPDYPIPNSQIKKQTQQFEQADLSVIGKLIKSFLYIQNTTKYMKNTQNLSANKKIYQIYNYQEMLEYELILIINSSNQQTSVKDALEIIKSENFLETHKALIQLIKTLSVLLFQQFNKNFDQAEIFTNELLQLFHLIYLFFQKYLLIINIITKYLYQINNSSIPLLFYLIEFGSTYILKLEATQIISIFAGGKSDISRIIFENGIVRLSQTILQNNHPELSMLMMVILGKLASDSIQYRDCILQVCNLDKIIQIMQLRYEATYIWCLANLCIGRPNPKYEIIKPVFNIFMKVIMYEPTQTNIKMMNDAIWALGYMLDGEPTRIKILIDYGIITRLIELMHQCNFVSILRIFECIFQGIQEQIRYLLECGFLSKIRNILDSKSREKSANMLQTFAATETLFKIILKKIRYYLSSISLFNSLMSENSDIRGDALEMIGNAVQHGTNEDVNQMVTNKLIQSILGMLDLAQIKEISSYHLKKGLEILIKILRKGEIRSKDRQSNQYLHYSLILMEKVQYKSYYPLNRMTLLNMLTSLNSNSSYQYIKNYKIIKLYPIFPFQNDHTFYTDSVCCKCKLSIKCEIWRSQNTLQYKCCHMLD